MRIGCLQFAPHVGDTENNLNRADSVLSKANPDDLDLLVLPELAFSGYNFKSLQDITPFLEPSGSGITSLWARTMALKYNCTVTVGYPEKVDVSPKWPTGPEYYNSAIVVNPDGETIANYRKSFLYYTDESWALEGNQGFYEGVIPGLGNTSIGICMDLNPYRFEAPWHAFEFAFHILEVESNLVILSMAWMTREERRHFTRMPNEPDMETLTYWVTRLEPLIRSDNKDEIVVVFCNRTGIEDEVTYAGTSAVIGIQEGEVKVYGLLGRGEKELLVVDTNQSPYAKIVYRPPEEEMEQGSNELDKSKDPPGSADTSSGKDQNSGDTPEDTKPDESQQVSSPGAAQPASDGGRSAASTAGLKATSAGNSPHPDQTNPSRGTPKKRSAPIKVPDPLEFAQNGDSAKSPGGTDNLNIPTPSAPSPTPAAIRPKLIIPESPRILPHQYPPDHPISAASLRSEKSTQSFRSDESEASTQTVRSNPRPPEDSTPYPHSGAPLSGYPANASHPDKQIYGGHVSVSHEWDSFTPTTPFDDISPTSPAYYWRPPDNLLQTPHTASTWTSGTPIGRKPEPFPWPILKEAYEQKTQAQRDEQTTNGAVADMRNGCQSPQSNASSNRTNKTARSGSTTGRSTSTTAKSKSSKDDKRYDKQPARPSSPKSRNASRSRMNERSNSTVDEKEAAAAAAQHLDAVSQRAESTASVRKESKSGTPIPDRPSSPKSRNCSRSRPSDEADNQQDLHTIPIAASPGLFRPAVATPEARHFYRPLSRTRQHQRSNSSANLHNRPNQGRVGTPTSGSNIPRAASRAASRGRQPGPQGPPVPPSRATSQDSIRNDRLHTRVSRRQSQGRDDNGGSRASGRSSAQRPDLSQFERVESVVCPNCPVHGQRSISSAGSSRGGHSEHSSQNEATRNDSLRPEDTDGDMEERTPTVEPGLNEVPKPQSDKSTGTTQKSQNASERSETIDYSASADTPQTTSSPGRSPGTRSNFDPPTPKAMECEKVGLSGGGGVDVSHAPNPNDIPPTRCSEAKGEVVKRSGMGTKWLEPLLPYNSISRLLNLRLSFVQFF